MSTATKLKKSPPRIWVTDEVTRKLVEEFETTGNTVLISLKFYISSDRAKLIRKRAMELMAETTIKNQALITEYDQD